MKKEIPVADGPIIIGNVTITLLVRHVVSWFYIKGLLYFDVRKQPVYAVLSRNGQCKITDMLGQDVTIDQAKSEFPCLDSGPAGAMSPRG